MEKLIYFSFLLCAVYETYKNICGISNAWRGGEGMVEAKRCPLPFLNVVNVSLGNWFDDLLCDRIHKSNCYYYNARFYHRGILLSLTFLCVNSIRTERSFFNEPWHCLYHFINFKVTQEIHYKRKPPGLELKRNIIVNASTLHNCTNFHSKHDGSKQIRKFEDETSIEKSQEKFSLICNDYSRSWNSCYTIPKHLN